MKSTSVVDETSIALFPDGKQEVRPSYSFLKREAENGAPKREKGPSQDWNRGGEIMEQLASVIAVLLSSFSFFLTLPISKCLLPS